MQPPYKEGIRSTRTAKKSFMHLFPNAVSQCTQRRPVGWPVHDELKSSGSVRAFQSSFRGTDRPRCAKCFRISIVKISLERVIKARRWSTGKALLFLHHGAWLVASATPRPLYPRKWPGGWAPGSVWTGAKTLVPTGIQSPDRPTPSWSLYLLSYPGPPQKSRRHNTKSGHNGPGFVHPWVKLYLSSPCMRSRRGQTRIYTTMYLE